MVQAQEEEQKKTTQTPGGFFVTTGYCVYILYSKKLDRFYVGMTENLIQRLDHHNHPINGEKYTARGIPWEFFLSIACESKIHAAKLERLIKVKKSRVFIQNLKLYPELVSKITSEANT